MSREVGGSVVSVAVGQVSGTEDIPLPSYATKGAAGMDLRAAIASDLPIFLSPGAWQAVPTGIILQIPPGYEAQVRPRSGLALRHGIGLLNSPGTIDADYRGEVQVILINHGREPFPIRRGDRIAQMVIAPVTQVVWQLVSPATLEGTERGAGGFGHTGKE